MEFFKDNYVNDFFNNFFEIKLNEAIIERYAPGITINYLFFQYKSKHYVIEFIDNGDINYLYAFYKIEKINTTQVTASDIYIFKTPNSDDIYSIMQGIELQFTEVSIFAKTQIGYNTQKIKNNHLTMFNIKLTNELNVFLNLCKI